MSQYSNTDETDFGRTCRGAGASWGARALRVRLAQHRFVATHTTGAPPLLHDARDQSAHVGAASVTVDNTHKLKPLSTRITVLHRSKFEGRGKKSVGQWTVGQWTVDSGHTVTLTVVTLGYVTYTQLGSQQDESKSTNSDLDFSDQSDFGKRLGHLSAKKLRSAHILCEL
eukprot:1177151-Prorocentrum_minimum.AAC.3